MKKKMIEFVAMLLIVSTLLASCVPAQTNPNTTENSSGSTEETFAPSIETTDPTETVGTETPDETVAQPTDPEGTEPTDPDATEDVTSPSTDAPTDDPTNEPTVEPTENVTDTPTQPATKPHVHEYHCDVTAATCTNAGKKVYTCSCGDSYSETIKTLGHNYVLTDEKAATIFADGYRKYQCSRCKQSKTETLGKLPSSTVGAIADEYCGESLFGKVLPHVQDSECLQDALNMLMNATGDGYVEFYAPGNEDRDSWDDCEYQYITRQMEWRRYSYNSQSNTTKYRLVYKQEDLEELHNVQKIAQDILAKLNINSSTKKIDAIELINDYLCETKYYDMTAIDRYKNGEIQLYTTTYSMTNAGGVCYNYSTAFQILCLEAGIECYYYSSTRMDHAWNKVCFDDGTELWVDVTWNDPLYKKADGTYVEVSVENGMSQNKVDEFRHAYLLIDTETLLRDHRL